MIELSILDLLYLVLTFFLVVIGTLLTISLLRLNKILRVGVELAEYYENLKQLIVYYAMASFVMKDKIFDYIASLNNSPPEQETKEQENPTKK